MMIGINTMGFMDMTRENKVNEFRRAADAPDFLDRASFEDSLMIVRCVGEEVEEFAEAAAHYELNQTDETRANLVKELADAQYVISQAACYYGIDMDPAFNRVHENNMTKVGKDGKVVKREDGKIMKPDGFKALTTEDMKGL